MYIFYLGAHDNFTLVLPKKKQTAKLEPDSTEALHFTLGDDYKGPTLNTCICCTYIVCIIGDTILCDFC